jgi:prepilin-type N-terminal cleavage/methylation domain-containing protein
MTNILKQKIKKGFTLVELLAVIAILALLIILALPNILRLYKNAQRDIFVNQVQSIYKAAEQKYITDQMSSSEPKVYCYDGTGTNKKFKLSISGGENIHYCIRFQNKKITSFVVSTPDYSVSIDSDDQFEVEDIKSYTRTKDEDGYEEVACENNLTIKQISFSWGTIYVLTNDGTFIEDYGDEDREVMFNVKQITNVRKGHRLFLMNDGTVKSYGNNSFGQLGNGTTNNNYSPIIVMLNSTTPLTGVKQVAAGLWHSVFLMNDGTVKAVGNNSGGQLGDGTTTSRSYPVNVMLNATTPLTGVKEIVTDYNHTLFLMNDGTVKAVGNNSGGQLGDGTTTSRSYPVNVMLNATTPLSGVKQMASDEYYSVFLMNDGTVKTSGDSGYLYSHYAADIMINSTTKLSNVAKLPFEAGTVVFIMEDGRIMNVGDESSEELSDGVSVFYHNYPDYIKNNTGQDFTNIKDIAESDCVKLLLTNDDNFKKFGNMCS